MTKSILLPNTVNLTDAQQDCVEKLEEALEQAQKGNVNAVAIVLSMRKGYAGVIGGTDAADLNLGLDSLKRKILDGVEKPFAGRLMV